MDITEKQYHDAQQIVNLYKLQQKEKYLAGLQLPCPSCGGETDSSGDCRKCRIVYLNGVHQINNCKEPHTHGNECYKPYIEVTK